jgi:hypothetical protein
MQVARIEKVALGAELEHPDPVDTRISHGAPYICICPQLVQCADMITQV